MSRPFSSTSFYKTVPEIAFHLKEYSQLDGIMFRQDFLKIYRVCQVVQPPA